jgi:hypothetical protein
LDPGTQIRLTGLCLVTYDQYRHAHSFRILLPQKDDIEVLSRPEWRNIRHDVMVLAAFDLNFLSALAWGATLRRRIATITCELQAANEKLLLLTAQDWLTCASNRRHFDLALAYEFQ